MSAHGHELRVFADRSELAAAAAAEFVARAERGAGERVTFNVALAGGSTPRRMFECLVAGAASSRARALSWDRIHVFWGDERHVPPDHADSNYRVSREAFLSRMPIPAGNIHRIPAEMESAAAAAAAYERELARHFALAAGRLPRFDLVWLGLGADGHTASLFPGVDGLHEDRRLVIAPWVEKLGAHRVTLTVPVINQAACVAFLVAGEEKAGALQQVLEGARRPETCPAQLIRPRAGELLWLVDRAAAASLRRPAAGSGRPGPPAG